MKRQSIGRENAIALANEQWWIGKGARDIAEFQMLTTELCCPFDVFHKALQEVLGRPVFTHELALNWDGVVDEVFNGKDAPTFEEIVNLIPAEKRLIVLGD